MFRPALCAGAPLRAVAQAAVLSALAWGPKPGAAQTVLPEVSVTGTAIARPEADAALPLTVLTRADIERSGARSTTELLQALPFAQGGVPLSTVVGTETHGYSGVSLHDLGDAYTLILLNGQRLAPFAGQSPSGAFSGVDVGTLPLAMIERIEVLRDGASALYGADALGGVINLITRRDDEANEATVGVSHPRGGAREWRLSAYKGVGNLAETGQNLSLAVQASHRSALRGAERAFANRSVRTVQQGGQAYRYIDDPVSFAALYAAPGNFYGFLNPALLAQGACPAGQTWDQATACLSNLSGQIDLVPETDQHSLMASYTRQLAPGQRWAADLLLARHRVRARTAPMPAVLTVNAGSPLYAAYPDTLGLYEAYAPGFALYRFDALGRRLTDDTSALGDLGLRLEGRLAGWSWQSGLKASVSHVDSRVGASIGQAAAQGLVDSGLLDPFAPTPSAAARAAIQQARYDGAWVNSLSRLYAWQGQASRAIATLPGGELRWALGLEARHESLGFMPSAYAQGLGGDLAADAASAVVGNQASRRVLGAFSEWTAPLSETLELGAAVRADHDSRAGSALTGKAQARWQIRPSLLGRASLGTGFRAPTLNQLSAPAQGSASASATCTESLQAQAQAQGLLPCTLGDTVTLARVQGGNPDLRPEHSVQGSIGLRLEPLPGHSLGLDLWAVHIRDRIGVPSETTVLANPAAVPGAWTTTDDGSGRALALDGRPHNLGRLMSTGIDVEASVRRGARIGLLESRLLLSTLLREDARAYAGGPWFSAIGNGEQGGATLKWRASWRHTLVRGAWSHTLTTRYQSGYLDQAVSLERLDASGAPTGVYENVRIKVPGQVLWDWQSSWQLSSAVQVTASVVNLFDTKPPLSLSQGGAYQGTATGFDQRYVDARGRILQLEARLSF